MTKKKNLKFILAFCLIAVVSALTMSLTGAWFTSNKYVGGTVTMAKVDVKLYKRNGSTDTELTNGSTTALNVSSALPTSKILFNDNASNKLVIKSADCNTPVYLRMTVFVTAAAVTNCWISQSVTDTTTNLLPSGWKQYGSTTSSPSGYTAYTYTYGTNGNTAATEANMTAGIAVYTSGLWVPQNAVPTSNFSVYIRVDAVQSTGVGTAVADIIAAMGGVATSWS